MNEQQFQLLYAVTARPILAYLIGVTGRRDVAEDLLQETFADSWFGSHQ
jgi:RNA polymerase sigma-70 factor, ECF subfamily